MMAFYPEHPKWDQNPKFTPDETTSIPTPFICGFLPLGVWLSKSMYKARLFIVAIWAEPFITAKVFNKVVVSCPDECAVESSRTWSIRTFIKDSRARFVVITKFLGRPCSVQSFPVERKSVCPFLKCCNKGRNKIYVLYDNGKNVPLRRKFLWRYFTLHQLSYLQVEHTLTNLKNFTEDRIHRGPGLHLQAQHLK